MNPEAEIVLKAILKKDLHELTDADVQFLRARWSYVGKNSRAKFEEVVKQSEKKQAKDQKEQAKAEPVVIDEAKNRAEWSEHPVDQLSEDNDIDTEVMDTSTEGALGDSDEDEADG